MEEDWVVLCQALHQLSGEEERRWESRRLGKGLLAWKKSDREPFLSLWMANLEGS